MQVSEIWQPLETVCDDSTCNESRRSCCDWQTENITAQTSVNKCPADERDFTLKNDLFGLKKCSFFQNFPREGILAEGRV